MEKASDRVTLSDSESRRDISTTLVCNINRTCLLVKFVMLLISLYTAIIIFSKIHHGEYEAVYMRNVCRNAGAFLQTFLLSTDSQASS